PPPSDPSPLSLHDALPICYSPATTTDPESLSAVLRNGDVLLTEGNTRAAALIKRITRSPWCHVSMYVGPLEEGPDPRCIVEADIDRKSTRLNSSHLVISYA